MTEDDLSPAKSSLPLELAWWQPLSLLVGAGIGVYMITYRNDPLGWLLIGVLLIGLAARRWIIRGEGL